MKVSEAITILEALDPNHEVTLDIGVRRLPKCVEPPTSAYSYLSNQLWQGEFWPPQKNEITCKLH
jgi:hypothetical protein